MNAFRTFWYVWVNSFSRAAYYKDVLKAPFAFSLKYFVFFNFLLSFVVTLFLTTRIFNPMNDFLRRFPAAISRVYPDDLEIRIRNGVVSTNVEEPYFVSIDEVEDSLEDVQGIKSDEIRNVLVIDTQAGLDDLKRYQTYALLTRDSITYYKDDGRIETVSLEDIKNFTLNQSFIQGQLNRFIPWLNLIPVFLLPFIFIASMLFFIVGQFIYLLIVAFLLFLGTFLISNPLSFWKAYQIDLHLATIITPFFLLLNALNFKVNFPFLKLIVFTLIGLYIVNSVKNSLPKAVKTKKSGKRS